MNQLSELKQETVTPEIVEKSSENETVKIKENKEKKIEKPAETLSTSTQNQAIEDWLDDLIIE